MFHFLEYSIRSCCGNITPCRPPCMPTVLWSCFAFRPTRGTELVSRRSLNEDAMMLNLVSLTQVLMHLCPPKWECALQSRVFKSSCLQGMVLSCDAVGSSQGRERCHSKLEMACKWWKGHREWRLWKWQSREGTQEGNTPGSWEPSGREGEREGEREELPTTTGFFQTQSNRLLLEESNRDPEKTRK